MKRKGYTLLELLVAMGIFSIFLVVIFGSIGNVYFSQKRLNVIQKFDGEARILMERMVKLARENTIDYDRYFVEVGPDSGDCSAFSLDQIPLESGQTTRADKSDKPNNRTNREELGYETIFSWDTNLDGIQDRNFGGKTLQGTNDDCVQVAKNPTQVDWDLDISPEDSLLLINNDRTKRFAFRKTTYLEDSTTFGRIEFQTQLGVDSDNDGVTDTWSSSPTWDALDSECEIGGVLITGENTEENCNSAHDWWPISLKRLDIQTFLVTIAPLVDPFLAFQRDDVQIHPRVVINLESQLKDADTQGFDPGEEPTISLQTMTSSRVFGNIR